MPWTMSRSFRDAACVDGEGQTYSQLEICVHSAQGKREACG